MYLFVFFELVYVVWWDLWECYEGCCGVVYVGEVDGVLCVFGGCWLVVDVGYDVVYDCCDYGFDYVVGFGGVGGYGCGFYWWDGDIYVG